MTDRGLTSREAARRLAAHGPNELRRDTAPRWWRDLLDQVIHPLALLLWLAALLSWLIGAPALSIAIVVVIGLNATFALVQERQTERSIEALSAYLPQHATARRDDRWQQVPATALVVGDVLLLVEGGRVCADGRLLTGAVDVDMSTLTGESVAVEREAGRHDPHARPLEATDLVFSGTSVLRGEATAVVVATGMQTELGRIAAMTQRVRREPSPLERQVRGTAWLIAAIAVAVALAFIPIGWLWAGLDIADAVVFAVGLIVANVPEGLLPTITLALAVGVRELARRGALVKRLSAVETLGSTDVICTDKTGTLTANRMHCVLLWTPMGLTDLDHANGDPPTPAARELAAAMARCSQTEGVQDPTDTALVAAAEALGARPDAGHRLRLLPFDARRRLMSSVDAVDGGVMLSSKGALESIVSRCEICEDQRRDVLAAGDALAARGLRVLAVADRPATTSDATEGRDGVERHLRLRGLAALQDPPREQVPDAIRRCHDAGIRVIVVTGDHSLTAMAVARQVGIGGARPVSVTGSDLAAMSEDQLDAVLGSGAEVIVSRSSPETKLRITDALRELGSVVAMTGDGVNDAPALRRADIGLAMGITGTDVAREASTMVLADDDFSTIVRAIEVGRRVYDNVRKFIVYIFAHATPEIAPLLLFALAGGALPLPLTVIQILAVDIGTETLPALALGREKAEPDVMSRPPRPRGERLITGQMLLRAWLVLGGTSAVLVTAGYLWVVSLSGWTPGDDSAAAQASTMTFLSIVACQVGTAFAARTERASLFTIGPLSNRLLLWGIAFELAFAAAIVGLPGVSSVLGMALPPWPALAVLPAFPLVVWGVDEAYRWSLRRRSAVHAARIMGS